MINRALIKTLDERGTLPLSILWKATLWLEKRYRERDDPALLFLIAQHYEMMADHPEAREDPHLRELLRAHARHWAESAEQGRSRQGSRQTVSDQRNR